jgi:hypothetical protein
MRQGVVVRWGGRYGLYQPNLWQLGQRSWQMGQRSSSAS